MSIPVLVAVPGPVESVLVAGWAGLRREVVVARRCADLAEVLAAAGAGVGRVVVLGFDLPGADAETVDELRHNDIGLVVLLPEGGDGDVQERHWRQLGARTFARAGDSPSTVARAVAAALDVPGEGATPADQEHSRGVSSGVDPPASPARAPGRTVAVWGPHGSAGRTTVAVNLGAELAQTGEHALVVDLDTRGAAIGQALGLLEEAPGVLAAVRAGIEGRLDTARLLSCAAPVFPGFSVLTGAGDPARWSELRPVGLRRVLEIAVATYDWVILDLPGGLEDEENGGGRDAITRTAFAAADVVVVVGTADPVGLQRFVRASSHLLEASPDTPSVPVISRVRAGAVGSSPGRRTTAALRRFAGVEDVVLLPEDPAADAALLAGRTLAEVAVRSPLRRALQGLAMRLDRDVDGPPWPGLGAADPRFDPPTAQS